MNRTHIILMILLYPSFIQSVNGQTWGDLPDYPKAVYRISVNGLSTVLERHIYKNTTIWVESGIAAQYGHGLGETENKIHLEPWASIQIRGYYGIEGRIERGKDVSKFSANYLAFVAILPYTTNTISKIPSSVPFNVILINPYSFGLQWGIQRIFLKHGFFTFNIGPALQYDKDLITIGNSPWFIYPALYVGIGL